MNNHLLIFTNATTVIMYYYDYIYITIAPHAQLWILKVANLAADKADVLQNTGA